eukprot:PhM_4_TR1244/c0_g1_i1/m.28311
MPFVMVIIAGLQLLTLTSQLRVDEIDPETIGWPGTAVNFTRQSTLETCAFNSSTAPYVCVNDGSALTAGVVNCANCANASALGMTVASALQMTIMNSTHRVSGLGFESMGSTLTYGACLSGQRCTGLESARSMGLSSSVLLQRRNLTLAPSPLRCVPFSSCSASWS